MMLEEIAGSIRHEMIDFIKKCLANEESLEDSIELIDPISDLSDYEVLVMYVNITFNQEWRGEFFEIMRGRIAEAV